MTYTLALIGGEEFAGGFEEVHAQLLQRTGKSHPKVAFLPTCAADDGAETIEYWCDQAKTRLGSLGARVETPRVVDLKSANNPTFARQVAEADWIYLGGGFPHVAMRILSNSQVLEALNAALLRGTLLSGASGGAMLMCSLSFVVTPELTEASGKIWESGSPLDWDPPLPPLVDCLGIIPHTFCAPHFNRLFSRKWLERGLVPNGVNVIGVDEQTALIGTQSLPGEAVSDWQVAGRGSVTVFHGAWTFEKFLPDGTVTF